MKISLLAEIAAKRHFVFMIFLILPSIPAMIRRFFKKCNIWRENRGL